MEASLWFKTFSKLARAATRMSRAATFETDDKARGASQVPRAFRLVTGARVYLTVPPRAALWKGKQAAEWERGCSTNQLTVAPAAKAWLSGVRIFHKQRGLRQVLLAGTREDQVRFLILLNFFFFVVLFRGPVHFELVKTAAVSGWQPLQSGKRS